jgi:hypothetical protein
MGPRFKVLTPASGKPLPKNGAEHELPHEEDYEKGLISSVCRNPSIIPHVLSKIDGACFYNPVNRERFERAVGRTRVYLCCDPDVLPRQAGRNPSSGFATLFSVDS